MTPFMGEIRLFAGDYAPDGWLICDGAHLSISDYEALFTLLGTTYGGDGNVTFALPDLRGRVPVHRGEEYAPGQAGGQERVMLTSEQLPSHRHSMRISVDSADSSDPSGRIIAPKSDQYLYATSSVASTEFSPGAVDAVGGAQPHDNMMPFQVVNFIIAYFGIYPSPN